MSITKEVPLKMLSYETYGMQVWIDGEEYLVTRDGFVYRPSGGLAVGKLKIEPVNDMLRKKATP